MQIYDDGDKASLSVSSNGNAIVAFEVIERDGEYESVIPNVLAATYSPATGWSAATSVALPTTLALGNTIYYPAAAINDSGDAIVAWAQISSPVGSYDAWANTYKSASGWGSAQIIESDTPYKSIVDAVEAPAVAIGSDGSGFAVWQQNVAALGYAIYANKYDPVAGWGAAVGLGDGELAHVGVDGNGNALAVWDNGSLVADTYD